MMANIVNGGDFAFNSLLYGAPTQQTIDYCKSTIDNARGRLGDAGAHLYQHAINAFNAFNNSAAVNRAKAIVADAEHKTGMDHIRYLAPEEITQASARMQRYVMVHPEMFDMNRDQMCSGYGGEYVDPDPLANKVTDHIDYRRAMDGMLQHDSKGNAYLFYHEDGEYEENTLSIHEQFSIQRTWDSVAKMIADNDDPSDPDGGEL